ncbi:MAG: ParA family protein [Chromatiaceae bacterium]|jgi:chromosome partitioning protein|nr:ParA family protein [Chromatiaceae bacterium]
MKTVAFFNSQGGIGNTTLVYHLAWMLAERGERVLAVDLDPQANLTRMFLSEDALEELWPHGEHPETIFGALRPIIRGLGDVETPHIEPLDPRLGLVVGDLALSTFEDKLSDAWPRCHHRDESAFRTMTAFYRGTHHAAEAHQATWVLIDVGPNLGAINRAALIASPYVVIPLGPDLFSLQGLRNLGPSLRTWRTRWQELAGKNPVSELAMPTGKIEPLGYVVMQHGLRGNSPPKAYQRWIDRFPSEYRESLLDEPPSPSLKPANDPYCLAMLKHYRSLMPMAMESRKPVFALKPADGAIGAHGEAVRNAFGDFLELTRRIADRCGAVIS